jgi:hypothetical protein
MLAGRAYSPAGSTRPDRTWRTFDPLSVLLQEPRHIGCCFARGPVDLVPPDIGRDGDEHGDDDCRRTRDMPGVKANGIVDGYAVLSFNLVNGQDRQGEGDLRGFHDFCRESVVGQPGMLTLARR